MIINGGVNHHGDVNVTSFVTLTLLYEVQIDHICIFRITVKM